MVQDGVETAYTYDALGQLIRVVDGQEGATWEYTYDQGGNILTKKKYVDGIETESMDFEYTNENWRDQLTKVNDKTITYDKIGNPLNDGTWTYTWQNGRQLKEMQKSGETVAFVYNENGLRVQKTVNGVVTKYTLHGKNIVHMTQGSNELHFFYDAQNKPAVVVYNGVPYSYVKNIQGDVVALLNSAGAVVVSYVYDAWGRPISKTGSMAATLGTVQPFRYRGYVYDEETELYYLKSRYYVSSLCRFVNVDMYTSTGNRPLSCNMMSYCENNAVTMVDPSGTITVRICTGVSTVPVPTDGDESTSEYTTYQTTISYYWVDVIYPYSMYQGAGETRTFEFNVWDNGIVTFANNQSSAYEMLDLSMGTLVAAEMLNVARQQVPGSMEGRTPSGMALELMIHYAAYIGGFKTSQSAVTHMGSNIEGAIGYDGNADMFERPHLNLDDYYNMIFK